jgi:biotin transport system substrate-specific component
MKPQQGNCPLPGENMNDQPLSQLHGLVWTGLLAALMVVGAYVHFPLGPVPISMQVCFVLLSGFVLGPLGGMLAVLLYILAGLAGLPVFYGGTSGFGHLLGPTGGYIMGFVFTPLITGLSQRPGARSLPWVRGVVFGFLGYVPIYVLGLFWLKTTLAISGAKAVGVGMLPFLPSDVLQVAASVSAARVLIRQDLLPPLLSLSQFRFAAGKTEHMG